MGGLVKEIERHVMRVAFVHPDLSIGGAERLVVDAAFALQAAGHRVVIYTTCHDPRRCFPETQDGTLDIRVRGNFLPSHIGRRFRVPCVLLRMLYLSLTLACERRHYDLLFCDLVAHIVPVLGWLTRLPIVFYCHFPDLLLTPRRRRLYRWYRLPIDRLEVWGMTKAVRILVNSQFTAAAFARVFPHVMSPHPDVLYPSVNTVRESLQASLSPSDAMETRGPSDVVLLSINRFESKKNIGLAIDALAALRHRLTASQFERVRLILAGSYDERWRDQQQTLQRLRAQTQALALSDRVEFVLSCSEAERLTWLSRCRCVIYTPIEEHFGLAPLEALAAGRPVVAVNRGGPLETIQHGVTGLLCEPTPHAFAAGLASLIRDQTLAAQMGQAGADDVGQRFSRRRFSARLEAILHDVVTAGDAPSS